MTFFLARIVIKLLILFVGEIANMVLLRRYDEPRMVLGRRE